MIYLLGIVDLGSDNASDTTFEVAIFSEALGSIELDLWAVVGWI